MKTKIEKEITTWFRAINVEDIPNDNGICIKVRGQQIAVFNFNKRNEYYAVENLCPHKRQMILSRGIIGDMQGEPKVACPFHKKTFSLKSGKNLNGEDYCIKTYPIKIEEGSMFIGFTD
ncbi:nitrite reductase small subunit NirD [Fulvivirgaceae bacterium BMA10]|uniref:Nitrite reductase small subunit NirD n=1 Tax=Splendidivirga corallicola TaxID=3051826 RepID=A0ABT8KUA9_9BACT|nr:nitrite reductase small subunit NirD [Fulvivirgaceae bacterium BMA10]